MKSNRKRQSTPKYTIGPCGEIYNNQPALSERSKQMLEMLMIKDAFEEAFKMEESKEDENSGTPEEGDQSLCD